MTRLAQFWRENWLTIVIVLALGVGWLALRSSPTEIASVEAFVSSLESGQPTVVDFYSNT